MKWSCMLITSKQAKPPESSSVGGRTWRWERLFDHPRLKHDMLQQHSPARGTSPALALNTPGAVIPFSRIHGSLRHRAGFSGINRTLLLSPSKVGRTDQKRASQSGPLSWHTSWAALLARREETHTHTHTHTHYGKPVSGDQNMESENIRSCCLLCEIFLFLVLQPRSVLKPHTEMRCFFFNDHRVLVLRLRVSRPK